MIEERAATRKQWPNGVCQFECFVERAFIRGAFIEKGNDFVRSHSLERCELVEHFAC